MRKLLIFIGCLAVSLTGALTANAATTDPPAPQGHTIDVTNIAKMPPIPEATSEQLPCYSVGVNLYTGEEFTDRTPCDYVISLEEAEAATPRQ